MSVACWSGVGSISEHTKTGTYIRCQFDLPKVLPYPSNALLLWAIHHYLPASFKCVFCYGSQPCRYLHIDQIPTICKRPASDGLTASKAAPIKASSSMVFNPPAELHKRVRRQSEYISFQVNRSCTYKTTACFSAVNVRVLITSYPYIHATLSHQLPYHHTNFPITISAEQFQVLGHSTTPARAHTTLSYNHTSGVVPSITTSAGLFQPVVQSTTPVGTCHTSSLTTRWRLCSSMSLG